MHLPGPGWAISGSLEQIEFFRLADGSPAVVHPELVEDIFGVGA